MAGPLPVDNGSRPLVAPSLLSADPLDIAGSVEMLGSDYDWIHMDIMDGHFVPNLSYGPSLVSACRKRWPELVLDVHLMVIPPEDFIELFASAGASILTVHQEATPHIHRVLQRIRDLGCWAGITLNPGTPAEILKPVLHMVDLVLVMSVNPGFGGQSFIPEVLKKTRLLCCWREAFGHRFLIEVDGGLELNNVRQATESGCDVIVAGSSIFDSSDPAGIVREIRVKAREGIISV